MAPPKKNSRSTQQTTNHQRKHQTTTNPARQGVTSKSPKAHIPDTLTNRIHDLRNLYDPILAPAFKQLVLTVLPIFDFLLAFDTAQTNVRTRQMKASLLSKLQHMTTGTSIDDIVSSTFYTILTFTLNTVLHTSTDKRLAWIRYKQGTMLPFIVFELSNETEPDWLETVMNHLKTGSGMRIVSIAVKDAPTIGSELVKASLYNGLFATQTLRKRLARTSYPRGPISSLPLYTNIVSPDNFNCIVSTDALADFPTDAKNNPLILTTILRSQYASPQVRAALGKTVNIEHAKTYRVTAPGLHLQCVSYATPPTGQVLGKELLTWITNSMVTVLQGSDSLIPKILENIDAVDIKELTSIPAPKPLERKVDNLAARLTQSKSLIIIGQKASGKTALVNKITFDCTMLDSDDFGNSLDVSLEAHIAAIITVGSYLRISPSLIQQTVSDLMLGMKVTLSVPDLSGQALTEMMTRVRMRYAAFRSEVEPIIADREMDQIYNLCIALMNDGMTLPYTYMEHLSQLKSSTNPLFIHVHTDSEAVAVRAVLRRSTVVGIFPGVEPTPEYLAKRIRAFQPFQAPIASIYAKDLIVDSLSIDAISQAFNRAWNV